jgi:hypothetical protein
MPNVKLIGRGLPKFKNEKWFHVHTPVERNIRHCVYSTPIILTEVSQFLNKANHAGYAG